MAGDGAKQGNKGVGGRQMGGGPGQEDMGAPGGSSGTGGYGNAQDRQNGGGDEAASGARQSRGERFDELAGGGRGADSVSVDQDGDDFVEDQQAHQDRGQSAAEDEV